jgi:hypothetical protein
LYSPCLRRLRWFVSAIDMKSKLKSKLGPPLAATMVGAFLFGATAAAATPITYAVALGDDNSELTGAIYGSPVGVFGVYGSITTDGKLGALTAADILDWSLVAVQGSALSLADQTSLFFQGPVSFAESPLPFANSVITSFQNVTATPLTLALTPRSRRGVGGN